MGLGKIDEPLLSLVFSGGCFSSPASRSNNFLSDCFCCSWDQALSTCRCTGSSLAATSGMTSLTTDSYCRRAPRQEAQRARCSCNCFCSSSVRSPEIEAAQSSRNSSWGRFEATPLLLAWANLASYCSRTRQFAGQNLFSQPFQPAEGMVPDVAFGLAKHLRDLIQRIAFDEVQPKRLLLVLR